MQPEPRVLVVGTTPDYIHWIRQSCAGEALFLTDPQLRASAMEPSPQPEEEILCDLSDYDGVQAILQGHLAAHHQQINGIACFDCESMELAAVLAGQLSLPFPSVAAVGNCRDKFLCKHLWQTHHLDTPAAIRVASAEEAVEFQRTLDGPVVLKPLSGSGSELIFVCSDSEACRANYGRIREGLRQRRNHRLYANGSSHDPGILAEAMIAGDEYSCDFIVQEGQAEVIRLTRKIRAPEGPFGTTQGYVLTAATPGAGGIDNRALLRILVQSAAALGIQRAVCMLDFIIHRGRMVLLEQAPRPGGDCLPFLLRQARDLDMLKLLLDFSRSAPLPRHFGGNGGSMVGLRIHARQSGILKQIDCRALKGDTRVREIHLMRRPGHSVVLPPEDYEAWLMGHVIFEPDGGTAIEDQCNDILDHIKIRVA